MTFNISAQEPLKEIIDFANTVQESALRIKAPNELSEIIFHLNNAKEAATKSIACESIPSNDSKLSIKNHLNKLEETTSKLVNKLQVKPDNALKDLLKNTGLDSINGSVLGKWLGHNETSVIGPTPEDPPAKTQFNTRINL
jgi:hypothetical protein